MKYFPYFIGQFVELVVSMKRVQDFLLCDTLNTTIVNRIEVILILSQQLYSIKRGFQMP